MILFCLCSLQPGFALPEKIELSLNADVTVLRRNYYVRDLVSVKSENHLLAERLLMLEVDKSPRPGYSVYISRHDIAALAERKIPGVYRQLHWTGADNIRVLAGGVSLASVSLIKAANSFLYEQFKNQYKNITVEALRDNIKDIVVPKGKVTLKPNLGGGVRLNKRTCVWMDIEVENEHFTTIPIWFSVSAFKRVFVARRTLVKSESLTDDMLGEEWRDIASAVGEPVVDLAEIKHKKIARLLSAGDIMMRGDIEDIPPVSKGQHVMVYAKSGSVDLKTMGIALNDGNFNQQIRIRNPQTSGTYMAVVKGDAYVRVE